MRAAREEPRRLLVKVAEDARGQQQQAASGSVHPVTSPLLLLPNREVVWLGNCREDELPHSHSSRELDLTPLAESGEDDRDGRGGKWDSGSTFVTSMQASLRAPTYHETTDIATDRTGSTRSGPHSHRGDAPKERERGLSGADTVETPAAGMTPPSSASFWFASFSCDLPNTRGCPPALVRCGGDTARRRFRKCVQHADPAHADCGRCTGPTTSTAMPTAAPSNGHPCFPDAWCFEGRDAMLTNDTEGDRSLCLRRRRCRGSSSCSPRDYWTMRPRLCGVNEALLQNASASSKPLSSRQVLSAFSLWDAPLRLELHGNSAGGTYMVRLARLSSSPTAPTSATNVSGDGDAIVAIFKPCDEEIGQVGNPHANCESDRTETFAPGSGSPREVLAYLLDHGHNAGVPPTLEVISTYWPKAYTTRVDDAGDGGAAADSPMCALDAAAGGGAAPASGGLHGQCVDEKDRRGTGAIDDRHMAARAVANVHAQIGSLQLFIPDCKEAADVLPGHFDVDEVHALAIFDIRTLNGDRHGGNVLVRNYHRRRDGRRVSMARRPRCATLASTTAGDRMALSPAVPSTAVGPPAEVPATGSDVKDDAPQLIPIDHSYICPSGYADPDYEWLSWPQSKKPFSKRNLAYIAALDAVEDAQLVRTALLAHSSAGSLSVSTPPVEAGFYDVEAEERQPEAALTSRTHSGLQRARAAAQKSAILCPASASLATRHTPQHHCNQCNRCTAAAQLGEHAVFSPLQTVPTEEEVAPRTGSVAVLFALTAPIAQKPIGASAGDVAACPAPHVRAWRTVTGDLRKFSGMDGFNEQESSGSAAAFCAGAVASAWSLSSSPSSSNASFPASHAESSRRVSAPVAHDRDAANTAADVIRCTTRLLQIAALEFHMTAYEIGSLCRRPRVTQASLLEEVLEESKDELTWEPVWRRFDDNIRQRLARRRRSAP
ncbi:hypothetical protein LSCM1_03567 [Leishmania martiniquensis]|uniref:PI3K/PI4K catalytic domain-containing protein n=1 Tax=Leishmania martiniquensis TaxID=1580590 RepID=A0A836KJQ9_9TRYP|nr:hypothetical protein LSCM1_03567 [Leishmania martiniquensis]